MIVDDPAIYMADFGVTVVSGAISGLGIFDMPSEMIIDNQIITTDYSLTCAASEFGHLLYGSQVSVNSGGSGLVFNGSGFYLTDYVKKGDSSES